MEGVTFSKLLAAHLNALHAASNSYIQNEANEKLQRKKTRISVSVIYEQGDYVYYKRKSSNYWKGPGKVIGYDNKQVVVKHGGSFVRVHPCSLRKVNTDHRNQTLLEKNINIDNINNDYNYKDVDNTNGVQNVNNIYLDDLNIQDINDDNDIYV